MYFAGIYIQENQSTGAAVVVEKVLRNAKKEYHIQDIRFFSYEKPGELVSVLESLHQDDRFLRKKKVFSQDKRPPKRTYTPPLLIVSVSGGGDALIDGLRESQIPVDALFFDCPDGWSREDLKIIRFGTNYHLHPGQMDKMRKVLTSPRITLSSDLQSADLLRVEMNRYLALDTKEGPCPDVFQDASFRILPPLFLALWHCETIFQVKRY